MKWRTKELTQTGLLLALCIASQFLKNTSVYLTGPIINAVLLIALFVIGCGAAVIISVITPITSFLITGSPIVSAIPLMIPVIMIGNVLLVLSVWMSQKLFVPLSDSKTKRQGMTWLGMGIGCFLKAGFMWIMTSYVLFPLFGERVANYLPKPEALGAVLNTARFTFSVTQLITAFLGCVIAFIILQPLKKYLKWEERQ